MLCFPRYLSHVQLLIPVRIAMQPHHLGQDCREHVWTEQLK